ncbi:rhodanese-like domain-containing protein [Microbacter sp. GSS18]|nr:rhodanese-like domain-containing protein [Microbacter sp. GSS18]
MSDISINQAYERMNRDLVVDVRENTEVAAGRIPTAIHIPLGELSARLGEIDRNREVIAVCRSGNRSSRATSLLKSAGYKVDNMTGGMMAWQAAGLPTV